MSEAVMAAIVGVGGAVIVAISAAFTQDRMTKRIIDAERQRLVAQLAGDERIRSLDRRHDRLLEAIADLLAAADPQIAPRGNYGKACQLILRAQLLLDPSKPDEAELNHGLSHLGLVLQDYIDVRSKPIEEKSVETRALLAAQDAVIRSARQVLWLRARQSPLKP